MSVFSANRLSGRGGQSEVPYGPSFRPQTSRPESPEGDWRWLPKVPALGPAALLASVAVLPGTAFAGTVTYGDGVVLTAPLSLTPPGDSLNVPTGTATQSGTISETGASTVTKDGAGTLILTGTNTYSGGTMVNQGSLVIGNLQALGTGAVTLNDGTALRVTTSGAINNQLITSNGAETTLAVAHGQNVTWNGFNLGTGSTLHVGSAGNDGTFTLTMGMGATINTDFTLSVDAGTFRAGDGFASVATSVGNSLLNVGAAGTYDLNGQFAVTAHLSGSGHITNNGAAPGTLKLSGTLNAFDGVIQDGSSSTALHLVNGSGLYLTGANTYSGGTIVDAGSTLGGDSTSLQGDIVDNGNVQFYQSGTGTYAGLLSGSGTLTKAYAGTLVLTGANTFSGGTTVLDGTLVLANIAALGTGSVTMAGNSTKLLVTTSGAIDNQLVTSNGVETTVAAAHGQNVTWNGFNLGTGSTLHVGSAGNDGTFTLTMGMGATINTDFTLSVDAGTFRVGDGFASIATSVGNSRLNIGAAGTYDLNGQLAVTADLAGSGHITNNGAAPGTMKVVGGLSVFDGVIQDGSNTTALHLTNNSTLYLSGANSYSGGTTIDAGSLLYGDSTSLQGNITDNGHLIFNQVGNGTYAGLLSGSGTLSKANTGTLVLSGANTFIGGTTVFDGTLVLANTTALGTGSVTMEGNSARLLVATSGAINNQLVTSNGVEATVAVAHGQNATWNSFSFGAGSTLHVGSAGNDGTLTLTSSPTGQINAPFTLSIDAGTFRPGDGFAGIVTEFAGSMLKVGASGTYDLNGVGAVTAGLSGNGHVTNNGAAPGLLTMFGGVSQFDGVIRDGGGTTALRLTNNSTLILTGANAYSGGTTIDAGSTLLGNSSSLQGNIDNDGTVIFNQTGTGTYAGALSGTGSLVKQGSGSLNLTGVNALTGPTTVQSGRLAVNGSLGSSVVEVQGGILGGNGTIGGIIVDAGGTVAPGNSVGTLHVAGNTSFNAGSTYQVEIDNSGNDLIAATGTATLGGGTVQVLGSGGYHATPYTILTAAGGVAGTFSGVTSNFVFLTPSLSYDPNAVYLTLASNGVSFQSVATTRNQRAAATAAAALGGGNAVHDQILGLDAAGAQAAFDSLSGELHAATTGQLLRDARYVSDGVLGRLQQADRQSGDIAARTLAALTPAEVTTAAGSANRLALWGQAFGGWSAVDGNGNAGQLDRSLAGLLVGLDGQVAEDWRLGLAAGYSHSDLDLNSRNSTAGIDSYHLALYGGGHVGPVALRLGAAYSFNDIDSSRDVTVGSLQDHDKASYQGRTAQVFGEIGYDLQLGPVALEPFAGMAYAHLDTDGFQEKGGATALKGKSSNQDLPYSTLGLRAAGEVAKVAGGSLTAHGMVGWRHAYGDVTPTADLSFAGGAGSFTVAGTPIARDALVAQAGLDLAISERLTVGLAYDGQIAGNAQDNAVQGSLSWKF